MMYKNVVTADTRLCRKCDTVKPVGSFNKNSKGSQGRATYCQKCQRQYYEDNKTHALLKNRDIKYRNRYGITLDQYKQREIEQGFCCLICTRVLEEDSLHVDHCHETEAVRGLLCPSCNKGLGCFKDDVELLYKAVEYLNERDR